MALDIGAPRIHFVDGFNKAHPHRDLPLTSTDHSHYLVQTVSGSEYLLELIANVTESEVSLIKQVQKVQEAKITFRLENDEHGGFVKLELEPSRRDGLKLHVQSHGPNALRIGGRRQVTGLYSLSHNDTIYIEDFGSFRVDFSNVKGISKELENAVVIPSSEGEWIESNGNGTVQTQQFFTPCANTDEASMRIAETPATSNTTSKSSLLHIVSNHDKDESSTEDENTNHDEKTSRATKTINDSDTEITPSVQIESKKRKSDTEIESPAVKRLKAVSSPTPKKPCGRPKKSPLTDKDQNFENTRRVRSKLTESEVVEDSMSKDQQSSTEVQESSSRPAKKLKVVIGSNLEQRPATKKFLDRFVVLSDKLDNSTDILCILNGELKSTIKIFKALALGIPIVSDRWLSDSVVAREMLPFENFLARDPKNEELWGVSENWASGNATRKDLFGGRMIMVTEQLKNMYGGSFKQLKEVCQLMGASDLLATKTLKSPKLKHGEKDGIIWLAKDGKDSLVKQLTDNTKVFSKDFLTASIFRGELDMASEKFRL